MKLKQLVTGYRYTNNSTQTTCHCGADYIGSTIRHLFTRSNEHRSDILHNHNTNCDQSNFNDSFSFSILETYIPSYFKLIVTEAIYIRTYKPTLNTMHTSNKYHSHTLKIL